MVEKLVAEQLSRFCEVYRKFHTGQMRTRKQRFAIDAATVLIQKVHEIWKNSQIAGALLMHVKRAFHHVSRARMVDPGVEDGLIGWTQSFLTDRWVELVIDGCISKHKVKTGIPQGSPVSAIVILLKSSKLMSPQLDWGLVWLLRPPASAWRRQGCESGLL